LCCGFLGIFRLHERLQVVEAGGPELAVLLEPGVDFPKRLGIELIEAMASFPALFNKMSAAKNAEVLGDRRPGDGEGAGNVPCGRVPARSRSRTARRVGSAKALKGASRTPPAA